MSYTLTGITNLGNVQTYINAKDAQLFIQSMPGHDSDQAFALDLFGAIRTINITAIFSGTTAEVTTMVGQLNGLINGNQSTKVFHSDADNADINVLVSTVNFDYQQGEPTKLGYTITLMQVGT